MLWDEILRYAQNDRATRVLLYHFASALRPRWGVVKNAELVIRCSYGRATQNKVPVVWEW